VGDGAPTGVFSSDEFLRALDDSWFGGRAEVAHVGIGQLVVRALVHEGDPVLDVSFLDFFAPVHGVVPDVRARYAPRVAGLLHPASAREQIDPLECEPAPFVTWADFATWDDVTAHWKRSEKAIVRESRRRRKRLEESFGALQFRMVDGRESAFRRCLDWKSAQFRDGGLPDPFENPREEALLRSLWRDGVAVLSTLEAGDRLVAAHLGLVWHGTTHWWLPTYDHEVASASPGRLLLEQVLQESYERGDARFDFLRGGSPYKWTYATEWWEVREVGRPPLRRRATVARKRAVRRYPRLADAARSARDVIRPSRDAADDAPIEQEQVA
jgi:CelD/BcsL family acetyltransferase involved in cellulose biosynthesis